VVFNIVPDHSEVRFILNEVLRGSPNQVTGRTNQIAGQIGVDFTTPANSQVGEIKIDARSLSTDNELRNRAIRGQILQSSDDKFEFISFKPTAITGLPDSVTVGQAFSFQIAGDLTIRDITKPVTFDVTVTPASKTQIEGTASATVQRSDYNLTIPNVPGVADVDQAVKLELDFIATVGDATPVA
jgi:polyisoprenoid-binding protein YceI